MRLIDANALEQIITEKFKEHYGNTVYQFMRDFFAFVIRRIRKAPTIEAEPVRHGRWVKDRDGDEYCENCFRYMPVREITGDPSANDYCPNCGAKMDATDINVGDKEEE